jgi:hypothetical protein
MRCARRPHSAEVLFHNTIKRDWRLAKLWPLRSLDGEPH